MHPYAQHKETHPGRAKARERAYSLGGATKDLKSSTKNKWKPDSQNEDGASEWPVPGRKSGGRLDKFARGGKTKHKGNKTNINILIGGKGQDSEPKAALPPVLPPGLPPPPPGGLPPGGPMGGPPPGMLPPGGPPMKPPGMMARGGRAKYKGGADSGVGRLEKVKNYGKRARSG